MADIEDIANYDIDSGNRNSENEIIVNQGEETPYYAEKILDKKIEDGKIYYQVLWQGKSKNDASWEPEENLMNLEEMIKDFESKLNKKKKSYLMDEEGDSEGKHTPSKKQKLSKTHGRDANIQQTEPKKIKKQPASGHLHYKDKPKEILAIRAMSEPGIFLFLVRWETRRTGEIPTDSYVTSDDFLRYNPRFLLEFYHSKIKFKKLEKADDRKFKGKRDQSDGLQGNLEPQKAARHQEKHIDREDEDKSGLELNEDVESD